MAILIIGAILSYMSLRFALHLYDKNVRKYVDDEQEKMKAEERLKNYHNE